MMLVVQRQLHDKHFIGIVALPVLCCAQVQPALDWLAKNQAVIYLDQHGCQVPHPSKVYIAAWCWVFGVLWDEVCGRARWGWCCLRCGVQMGWMPCACATSMRLALQKWPHQLQQYGFQVLPASKLSSQGQSRV